MQNSIKEKYKLTAIITYNKRSGKEDELFMYIMANEDDTHQKLIESIINYIKRCVKIGEDNIKKIDCACYKEYPLFNEYNGTYYRRYNKWFVGLGGKMDREYGQMEIII